MFRLVEQQQQHRIPTTGSAKFKLNPKGCNCLDLSWQPSHGPQLSCCRGQVAAAVVSHCRPCAPRGLGNPHSFPHKDGQGCREKVSRESQGTRRIMTNKTNHIRKKRFCAFVEKEKTFSSAFLGLVPGPRKLNWQKAD